MTMMIEESSSTLRNDKDILASRKASRLFRVPNPNRREEAKGKHSRGRKKKKRWEVKSNVYIW